jgi:hypothetical protein
MKKGTLFPIYFNDCKSGDNLYNKLYILWLLSFSPWHFGIPVEFFMRNMLVYS